MSQAVPLAKAAREKLAAALNALQSEAEVPEALLEVAEPIAQAMSVLHRVERSQGSDLEGRDRALDAVRRALDMLQKIEQSSSAVDLCLEAVAASLAKVHALAKVQAPAAAPVPAPSPVGAVPAPVSAPRPQPAPSPMSPPLAPVPAPQPAPSPALKPAWPPAAAVAPAPAGVGATQLMSTPAAQPPAPAPTEAFPPVANRMQGGTLMMTPQQAQEQKAPAPQAIPAPVFAAAPQAIPAPVFAAAPQAIPAPVFGAAPQAAFAPAPAPTQPFAQPPVPSSQPVHQAAPLHQSQQQVAQAYQPQPVPVAQHRPPPVAQHEPPKQPATAAPAGSVVVELGAHSVSNFYKGLSGNDVIEHGGIFVGTYKIPKIGATVSLRVLLPGDYEFHASGTVQWVREAGDGVEPGFGAKFTQITPEGRQLVYRYARNREPIFYDDL